jgi:predicted GNAT family acetyltransferase
MRCAMKIEKATAGSRTTNEAKRSIVASIEFAVRASLREEYGDADFVHAIHGKISAKAEDRGNEEDVGYIKASSVQFDEAMDHGISTERLGDGIDGNIAEYWELLFDLDTGCWKEEVQDEYEASGCDLLIIDCVEISPTFRGKGVGRIAIDRTIDIFGPVCGLVACKPWPLQFTQSFASDRNALNRLKAPRVGEGEAVRKLRTYWSKLGFWPLGETGIYVLGMAQRESARSNTRETLVRRAHGLAGGRFC